LCNVKEKGALPTFCQKIFGGNRVLVILIGGAEIAELAL
jgi:hypothetical protein